MTKLMEEFDKGITANMIDFTPEEKELLKSVSLLTLKPVIYAANVHEESINHVENHSYIQSVVEIARMEKAEIIPVCAQIEAEIAELDEEEKGLFLEELGLKESGLDKLIRSAFSLLGLMTFFTAGTMEVRAWTIRKNTRAPQAAGTIHTDFERGFIRAEVVSYDAFTENNGLNGAREKGLVRLEGKEYIMQDGDIVHFRFNV